MTKAQLYALIDQIIKVNPLVTDTTKTRGADERSLLKNILDYAEAGADIPFNGERTITAPIPGLQGKTLHGSTEKTVLRNLLNELYIDVAPTASISLSNAVRELGDPSAILYTWSVASQTNPITGIVVNGVNIPVTGLTQTGSGTKPANTASFNVTATDGTLYGGASASPSYLPARFFGASAKTLAEMVTALTDGNPINYAPLGLAKQLASDKNVNNNYDCTGGKYIYVLYAAAYGNPALVRSGVNTFSAYTITDVTVTDIFGIDRDYKLLSTGIQFGAAVNIAILN